MNFVETPEQGLLRQGVRRFAAKAHPFKGGRPLGLKPEGQWKDVAANGWTTVGLGKEVGGFGPSPVEVAIILEEFGRGLVVEPFVSCILLAARAIELLGDARRRAMLARVIDGDLVLAFAHEERQMRGVVSHIETRAERVAEGWRIKGVKICAYGAAQAQILLASARTSGSAGDLAGLSLFLAPAVGQRIERACYRTIDGFDAADVAFDEAILPADAIVGAEGEAGPALEDVIDFAIVGLSAEAVGAMERAFQLTRDYVALRRQFGQPIGSFQAVQHRLADMLAELELGRSALHYALASRFEADRQAQSKAASACKARIGKAARFVCENAIQLHGGFGMADDAEVGHHYRRVLAIEATLGDTEYHLQRFASLALRSWR